MASLRHRRAPLIPMFTLFTTTKPFTGRFDTIQRNALASWRRLIPPPEIILFGDESGAAEYCREAGLRHVPGMECNGSGAPLLDRLFEAARRLASHELLCYVNADMVLLQDFAAAMMTLASRRSRFLAVGRRWGINLDHPLNFEDSGWGELLRRRVLLHGHQAPPPGNSDYFAFPRDLWRRIPPFALGRGAWDAWLVYEARRLGADVVDASESVMAIHQDHDQSTYPYGLRRWRAEVSRNERLAGPDPTSFTLRDATMWLTPEGAVCSARTGNLARRLECAALLSPLLAVPYGVIRPFLGGLRLLRRIALRPEDPLVRLTLVVRKLLPEDGVTAILGLGPREGARGTAGPTGYRLAHALLGSGHPVMIHDPRADLIGRARRALGGPVAFAESPRSCVEDCSVVVVTVDFEEYLYPDVLGVDVSANILDCTGSVHTNERRVTRLSDGF